MCVCVYCLNLLVCSICRALCYGIRWQRGYTYLYQHNCVCVSRTETIVFTLRKEYMQTSCVCVARATLHWFLLLVYLFSYFRFNVCSTTFTLLRWNKQLRSIPRMKIYILSFCFSSLVLFRVSFWTLCLLFAAVHCVWNIQLAPMWHCLCWSIFARPKTFHHFSQFAVKWVVRTTFEGPCSQIICTKFHYLRPAPETVPNRQSLRDMTEAWHVSYNVELHICVPDTGHSHTLTQFGGINN